MYPPGVSSIVSAGFEHLADGTIQSPLLDDVVGNVVEEQIGLVNLDRSLGQGETIGQFFHRCRRENDGI